MKNKLYPSIFGRLIFLILSLCSAFIYILVCVTYIFDSGIMFAADDILGADVFALIFVISFTFIVGLITLHFISLAISLHPSIIFTKTGILYKSMGVLGYEHINWQHMRVIREKGIFKDVYMKLLIPKNVQINKNQNIIYKTAIWLFKIFYKIITFSFMKSLSGSAYKRKKVHGSGNFQKITIYRANVDVSLSEVEKILNEKIELYASKNENNTAPVNEDYEPAVIRVEANDFSKKFGKAILLAMYALIIITPFSMISLGSYNYKLNLQTDPTIQSTQLLRKRALSGDADSQNKFGWRLSNSVGVPKSQRRAKHWYLRAAKQGHAKAQYNVGLSYNCKKKKKSNCKEAVKWFRKASNNNLHLAQSRLAYHYYTGWGIKNHITTHSIYLIKQQ